MAEITSVRILRLTLRHHKARLQCLPRRFRFAKLRIKSDDVYSSADESMHKRKNLFLQLRVGDETSRRGVRGFMRFRSDVTSTRNVT